MATKIVIEVSGGMVQAVYCDAPEVTVVLVDWDTDGGEPSNGTHFVRDKFGTKHLVLSVEFPKSPMDVMPQETRAAVDAAR